MISIHPSPPLREYKYENLQATGSAQYTLLKLWNKHQWMTFQPLSWNTAVEQLRQQTQSNQDQPQRSKSKKFNTIRLQLAPAIICKSSLHFRSSHVFEVHSEYWLVSRVLSVMPRFTNSFLAAPLWN